MMISSFLLTYIFSYLLKKAFCISTGYPRKLGSLRTENVLDAIKFVLQYYSKGIKTEYPRNRLLIVNTKHARRITMPDANDRL